MQNDQLAINIDQLKLLKLKTLIIVNLSNLTYKLLTGLLNSLVCLTDFLSFFFGQAHHFFR